MKLGYLLILIILFGFNINSEEIIKSNIVKDCNGKLFTRSNNGLNYSVDNGKSWQRVTELPSVKVVSVYTREMEVFVLTEKYGMFYSMDCGKSWESVVEIFENIDEQVFNL